MENKDVAKKTGGKSIVFTFGEPEPALERTSFWDYLECVHNNTWYDPPMPFDGLAKSFRANAHHESAIKLKRNTLLRSFVDTPLLPQQDFSALAQDYIIFGNAFPQKELSKTGSLLKLKHNLARYVRRHINLDDFVFLQFSRYGINGYSPFNYQNPYTFPTGSIYHLKEPDINQDIYGMPEYLGALQSVWLNEAATLFRRKYYRNGSHAGYILYINDELYEEADVDELAKKVEESKGIGNFKNLLLYAPGGKKDGVQLMPIAQAAAKDEFLGIKNVSRDDILVAHRTPPQLLGIVPQNSGGFGSIADACRIYLINEINPLQDRFKEINSWLGQEVLKFKSNKVMIAEMVSSPEDM